jgi:TctA family transporter
MIPQLTLGITGSGATAVMMGAFLLHRVDSLSPYIFPINRGLISNLSAIPLWRRHTSGEVF